MKKDLDNLKNSRLHVGSGVEDVYDNNLHTVLDEYGQYGADYNKASNSKVARLLLNSDSSRSEDEIAKSVFAKITNVRYNTTFGYYLDLYVGHVTQDSFRKKGSSGGFVSWVATKLLENGEIDGFIHVRKTEKSAVLFEYGISRTVNEIRSGAKSRYYPAELSKALKEVQDTPGRYAVVAIPEIITELRLLAENNEVIDERIKYYFGLVCGHQKTTKYAEAIAWEYGIKPGDLEDIDFRSKRHIGTAGEYDMKLTGRVGKQKKTFIVRNNEPFVSSWAHGFFKARFSDFTDNSFNELADITFGDAWLDEYIADPQGSNILIIRNKKLATLVRDGISADEIQVDAVTEDTIIRSQQGLVHHTRDELPYRLYKENKIHGWAPVKRVEPSDELSKHRKKVQDIRQHIAEKSHTYYSDAVARNDFEYFKEKMNPYVDKYKKLYGQPVPKKKKKVDADGAILTLTGYFNYGNVLQRYALQKSLRNNGHNFVSYVDPFSAPRDIYKIGWKIKLKTPLRAVKRFFNYQKPYWYIPSFGELYPEAGRLQNIINFVNKNIWIKPFNPDDNYKNYIVGSDQVWRDWWGNRETIGYYFFNFLKGKKINRISYAASFGKDKINEVIKPDDVDYLKPYVQEFNKISVREKSGIKIIKDAWGVDEVNAVVDPTLLLDASDYSELIDNTDVRYEKIQPIFSYVLGETPKVKKFIERVQESRKQAITKIRAHQGSEDDILPLVEFWLKGFRDAELVITNSFHGMMFSVINNTDFIIIGKENGGLSRIHDFLEQFSIKGRFIDENQIDNFNLTDLQPIKWDDVNKKLDGAKQDSLDWLLGAVRGED